MAAFLEGSLLYRTLGAPAKGQKTVRIGHPSGVMTMVPYIEKENGEIRLPSVAVQRTARRIMEGTLYIRN